MAVLLEPVFVKNMVQDSGVPEQFELPDAETIAVLVKVPKSPNTNPEMAVAAMRVTAMIITVARTADIPFFRCKSRDRKLLVVRDFRY
jgi:hypothetical protein